METQKQQSWWYQRRALSIEAQTEAVRQGLSPPSPDADGKVQTLWEKQDRDPFMARSKPQGLTEWRCCVVHWAGWTELGLKHQAKINICTSRETEGAQHLWAGGLACLFCGRMLKKRETSISWKSQGYSTENKNQRTRKWRLKKWILWLQKK